MTNTVLSYPIPAYSNPPIQPEFYKPRCWVISAIGLGRMTLVTATTDMDYQIGQQVRFNIPSGFGTRQLNQMTGFVLSIPSDTQVVVDIDSLRMDAFINASLPTKAQIVAIGDTNTGQINNYGRIRQRTYIPGSFRNISPSEVNDE